MLTSYGFLRTVTARGMAEEDLVLAETNTKPAW
jgi:hypothetical protein